MRLAREARAARPRPFPRDCFLVGVVRGVAGERGAVLSTLVLVVIGESGEEEMVGVCWVADVVLGRCVCEDYTDLGLVESSVS